ncbi:hypothetical protein B0T09DRAFT_183927 [Sordaria sp. MPI-SDFR-AT-0083]|nr:hypothetical protein B0T09DRAFT_183927 [Sordaria sp. MPI-SDFR-AT-0083]
MDRPPNKQGRQNHGSNVPIQHVPENQPSIVNPDMTARSYPTPNDIHETGIVRDRQLGECVNATFTSSQDNLNVASTSNTTPTDPRATNPTSGQAIPATGPLKQQCCSRYHPNSGPHPRRRGRSLGDVGHQVSHHQYHAQGPSRIPSQASTTSHSSSFQARPSEFSQSSNHHISHVSSPSYSHPSTAPYQPQYQVPSHILPGHTQPLALTGYPSSHEPHGHQTTRSLSDVPYQLSHWPKYSPGQGPNYIPLQFSQYPTHDIPQIPTHTHTHSHSSPYTTPTANPHFMDTLSHSSPYTTPTANPHFMDTLFRIATSNFQSTKTTRGTRPACHPSSVTIQPSFLSSAYPVPSNPLYSHPLPFSNPLAFRPLPFSHLSLSNPSFSHPLPSNSLPFHPASSNPLPTTTLYPSLPLRPNPLSSSTNPPAPHHLPPPSNPTSFASRPAPSYSLPSVPLPSNPLPSTHPPPPPRLPPK